MSERLRAAIWARVSSDKQEDGASLDTQLDECRRFCAEREWTVVRAYRVVHTIEYIEDIPEWAQLKEMVRRREIDRLVVFKFDRITGDERDIGTVTRFCERHGVMTAFVHDDVPEGDYADLLRLFLGFHGRKRRETIIEATGRGQRAKMRGLNGSPPRPLGSQWPPFGLRWTDEVETKGGVTRLAKRRLEENPETIEALRLIFRWYDEGASLRGITKRLEAVGIPTAMGRTHWSAMTLRGILTNENYIGIGHTGKAGPREEWTRLPDGTFPRVIDEARFARVQERLEQNKRESQRWDRNPEVGLLRRGLGVCGYCGHTLNVGKYHNLPYYRCGWENRDRYGCSHYAMSVSRLDEQVWTFICWLIERPGALEAKLFGQEQPDPTLGRMPEVEVEIAKLTKERDAQLKKLRATDDADLTAAYEADVKTILADLRSTEARRELLRAEHEAWRVAQARRRQVLDAVEGLRDEMDGLDWHGRRNILARLGVTVRLFREGDAEPRWDITTRFHVGRASSTVSNASVIDYSTGKPFVWSQNGAAARQPDAWIIETSERGGTKVIASFQDNMPTSLPGVDDTNVYISSVPDSNRRPRKTPTGA